jgi:hypothetical protein
MSDTYQSLRDRAADIKASGRVGTRFKRYPVDPDLNPYDLPLDDLDVANPELFKHGLFERYFERLRAEAPVHWCRSSQYGPYWSITRYDDIMAIEKAHDVFSSDHVFGGVTIMGNPNASNPLPMFIQMDPPKHDQQRRAVAPRFTQRSLAELEGLIRQRVENILDGLPVRRIVISRKPQRDFSLPKSWRHKWLPPDLGISVIEELCLEQLRSTGERSSNVDVLL